MNALLPNYDLNVMPSVIEGFSLSVLESMAMKIPLLLSDIVSFPEECVDTAIYFSTTDVQDLVQTEGPNILRSKGILAFKNDDERFVFQGVHMILDGDHQRPWNPGEPRLSRIVFIGRNLPQEKIRQGFESCVA